MKRKLQVKATAWKAILLAGLVLAAGRSPASGQGFQTLRSFGQLGPSSTLVVGRDGYLYGTSGSDGTKGAGTVFRITTNGLLTILHSFTGGEDGANPLVGLLQGASGEFYGTTSDELGSGAGSVFRMAPNGTLSTVYRFTGLEDGSDPICLLQARDGNLYGTTLNDGVYRCGTIFRLTTNGTLATLYSFSGQADGAHPVGGLIQAGDGFLYGTTTDGGNGNSGTVFRIGTHGGFTTTYRFNGTNDGRNPWAGLIQGRDGNLYGTTFSGGVGTADNGTVFRITLDGVFKRLHAFAGGNNGRYPYAGLVQADNGVLYGTSLGGGTGDYGTVFRLDTNGVFAVLHSFTYNDGARPVGGLVQAGDGNCYGTTRFGGAGGNGTAYRLTLNGAFSLLRSFPAGYSGISPLVGLAPASDGRLYGTTLQGGPVNQGTIFGIGTDGAFTSLHAFTSGINDGRSPRASLVEARDGNLYGTTEAGGTNDAGTVFRVTPRGVFTLLHSFTGGNDGAHLWSGLLQGRDGRLYGTTGDGGANGNGIAFRMTLNGDLTPFYSFAANVGGGPRARLIQASDGAFYGTSSGGGASGQGTVYRLTTNGSLTVLHSFTSGPNGYYLTAPLIQASDGHLYGTTDFGGTSDLGTVFRLTLTGAFTRLYSFSGFDGDRPSGGLVQASDGYFYGTTSGNHFMGRYGTVYRIATNGMFNSIYSFTGGDDGQEPAGLVQAADGNLYGTTYSGGILSSGTVFRVLIAPPVLQSPLFADGQCVFNLQTLVRHRYTIEQREDLSTTIWSTYITFNGNGSLVQFAVPVDYYPEQYFRVGIR